MKKFIIALLMISCVVQAQDFINKVIPLNYAQPKEVASAIQPMLAPGESVRVYQNSLILLVSPGTLTQIRLLAHQLDVAPSIFLVSVHQGNAHWLEEQEDSVHYSSTNNQSQADNQAVQVQNGSSAFVSTGSDYPVVSQVGAGWNTGVSYQRMQAEKGFLIIPELKGSRVKITIKRMYSQQSLTQQEVQQEQQSSTTTIISLDRWTKLVQTGGPENNSDNSNHYTAGKSFDTNGTLYIKISLLSKN